MGNIFHLLNPLYTIRLFYRNKDLLWQMLIRNIASRYKGSILGFIWSFAHPLVMLAVYTFVFGIIFKSRWGVEYFGDNRAAFPLIMFCGMAIFNVFSESVNSSSSIVLGNPSYVKKVVFPLEILPICNVATSFFFGIAWFLLLFLGTAIFLGQVSWTMLLIPITLIPLFFFAAGISFFVASLGVYLRDTPQLVGIVMQILFFMTPIFYPISVVPENLRWILQLNPLSIIVEQTRLVFLYGQPPVLRDVLLIFVISLSVFQLGFAWYAKTKKGFADVL